ESRNHLDDTTDRSSGPGPQTGIRRRRHDDRWFGGFAAATKLTSQLTLSLRYDLLIHRSNNANGNSGPGGGGKVDFDDRNYDRHRFVARPGIEHVAAAGERVQGRPAFGEIVRPGERDDRAQPLLVRRRPGTVDASHADAHQPDAVAIDVLAIAQAVEDGGDYRSPFRPDRESRRVLRLARTVHRQGRHAPPQE